MRDSCDDYLVYESNNDKPEIENLTNKLYDSINIL